MIKKNLPTPEQMIDFIWHSNRIDYNTIEPAQLERFMVEGIIGDTFVTDPNELKQHHRALKRMISLSQWEFSLSAAAQAIHRTLMKGLLHKPGRFRRVSVFIGGEEAVSPWLIPAYMDRLDLMLGKAKTAEDAWAIHDEFETIHPFEDGNGRTGRLLLNLVRLKLGLPLFTVTYGKEGMQYHYYRKIREYKRERFKPL